ncbi:MAG: chromophore lyase CpcT/CpeT [Phycisphaerales bacterium]|nr:MAG: chromophore lyase CpcT/CpeT [Phycisphaerales bacterium]
MQRWKLPLVAVGLTALAGLASCETIPRTSAGPAPDDALAQLAEWMTGTFSSAAQSDADPENYFDIRLVMIPIWPHRTDGWWLYVEQAAAESADRPYRQRVYRLTQEDAGTFRSDVYALPGNPLLYAACWRNTTPLSDVDLSDLTLRDGCSIVLLKTGPERFAGGTVGEGCESSLRGAAYATSDVIITPTRIVSWDQGWDENGNQVWGATEGGYIFEKISLQAPD